MKAVIKISKDVSGRIRVSFSYNPGYLLKVKAIPGYRWHPREKQWSFPDTDEIIEKILKVFKVGISTLRIYLQFGSVYAVDCICERRSAQRERSK